MWTIDIMRWPQEPRAQVRIGPQTFLERLSYSVWVAEREKMCSQVKESFGLRRSFLKRRSAKSDEPMQGASVLCKAQTESVLQSKVSLPAANCPGEEDDHHLPLV